MTRAIPVTAKPITQARLHQRVVEELLRQIVSGALPPGTTLPSEPELARQFGVSRIVIREAIRILVEKGLITVRHGSGMWVQSIEQWNHLDPMVLLEKSARARTRAGSVNSSSSARSSTSVPPSGPRPVVPPSSCLGCATWSSGCARWSMIRQPTSIWMRFSMRRSLRVPETASSAMHSDRSARCCSPTGCGPHGHRRSSPASSKTTRRSMRRSPPVIHSALAKRCTGTPSMWPALSAPESPQRRGNWSRRAATVATLLLERVHESGTGIPSRSFFQRHHWTGARLCRTARPVRRSDCVRGEARASPSPLTRARIWRRPRGKARSPAAARPRYRGRATAMAASPMPPRSADPSLGSELSREQRLPDMLPIVLDGMEQPAHPAEATSQSVIRR
jgi:DNA-binding transcriptional regulator YhcF (GntR family)